jgi:acyl carrier protein
MIFEKLAKVLAEHCETEISRITMDPTFEELGVDSLDTVEMLMELEEELGVPLELDEKLETVGQMVRFIEQKIG